MKILPLVLTLTALAFYNAKAQVPDSEQPLEAVGKITLIDTSGHHIGIETLNHDHKMFVYQPSGLVIIDQAGKTLAMTALQNGITVNIAYADLNTVGRLLANKIVVFPGPPIPADKTPTTPAAPAAAQ
jgi:hypothetical protein